ncbi:hypothetical protein EVAR_87365_1 [Eumeta japonica]|uniref:Uncharacterized protein n=1 Tax=Eumeta variegata TaxID=151549 RepID=A0A4C1XZM1_EUMVA|nr:hypothetical protein EVAR_87365_1 [Eumeta japonica]
MIRALNPSIMLAYDKYFLKKLLHFEKSIKLEVERKVAEESGRVSREISDASRVSQANVSFAPLLVAVSQSVIQRRVGAGIRRNRSNR